jgi:hypothetical protein
MICLVCVTNAALLAAGASSTGVLTALSARVFRRSKNPVVKAAEDSAQRRIDNDQDSNRTSGSIPNRVAVRP